MMGGASTNSVVEPVVAELVEASKRLQVFPEPVEGNMKKD